VSFSNYISNGKACVDPIDCSTLAVSVTKIEDTCPNKPVIFTAIVSGGIPPFQYDWSFGEDTDLDTLINTMNIVDVGQQQLTVTDVNGCSVTEVFIVEEQPSPIITQADFDYTLTTDSILLTNLSKGAIINTQWTTSTPELIVDNKVALPPPGL